MSEQSDALNYAARNAGVPIGDVRSCKDVFTPSPRSTLPLIPLPRDGRQVIQFAEEVGAIVGANGMFRRDDRPVTVNPETGRVEEMDAARFRTYVEEHLVPFAWRGNTQRRETMTLMEAQTCLRCDAFVRPLRRIRRVNKVRLPVMRRDGRIELLPKGYDPESQIFTVKDALDYDPSWSFEAAKLFLDDLLGEFPFEHERSRAVHVVAMLSVFGADLLAPTEKRLNFLYRANMPRTGKGLLVATAIAPAHGDVCIQALPDSADEFKKVLDSEALNGSPYIFFDELPRRLRNRTLNSFLTATTWSGRHFYSQRQFAVPQTSVVFMTGNNVELSADLAGRCLLVDLYTSESDPQSRKITRVIDENWLARGNVRADCLAALWALVTHWDRSLRPQSSAEFRGFERFSRMFGGIVEAAGYDCPLHSMSADVDPDYADMHAVVDKLSAGVTDQRDYDFTEIVDVCRSLNAFEYHTGGEGELSPAAKSFSGHLFSRQYAGVLFHYEDGRTVRFGKRGRNRQRRYTVAICRK